MILHPNNAPPTPIPSSVTPEQWRIICAEHDAEIARREDEADATAERRHNNSLRYPGAP